MERTGGLAEPVKIDNNRYPTATGARLTRQTTEKKDRRGSARVHVGGKVEYLFPHFETGKKKSWKSFANILWYFPDYDLFLFLDCAFELKTVLPLLLENVTF